MTTNNLLVLNQELPKDRAKILYEEFQCAWENTSTEDKKKWAIESLKLFGKVTLRRGKGLVSAVGTLGKNIGKETYELGTSIWEDRFISHIQDRKTKTVKYLKTAGKASKSVLSNLIFLLRNNPKETAPMLFLGLLGFFCGSGGIDGDGGIPDLDIAVGGIGLHRSIFFHSIISAAILETVVYSSVNAITIFHSKLPQKHDPFWDNVISKKDWAKAFVTGACTGIAYHLLLDGTIQGGKALSDAPFSMPMEGHNAFFVTNAAAEALDLDKKEEFATV